MMYALISAALAGAPTVEILGSDTVVGHVSVPLEAAAVRQRLADPAWITRVDGEGTTVTIERREGPCLIANYVSPNALLTARYQVKQCPTAQGHAAELISSNAFETYRTEWKVLPEGSGSRVEYRITLRTSLMVPSSFVTRSTRKGVEHMLGSIAGQLGGVTAP